MAQNEKVGAFLEAKQKKQVEEDVNTELQLELEVNAPRYVGLMWSLFLEYSSTFAWYMARLLVKIGHQGDTS